MWQLASPCVLFLYKSIITTHSFFPCTRQQQPMAEKVTSYQTSIIILQYWLWCKVINQPPLPVPQMAFNGYRNVKNLPLDSEGKRGWSFGLLSCCGDCGACKYSESLREHTHLRSFRLLCLLVSLSSTCEKSEAPWSSQYPGCPGSSSRWNCHCRQLALRCSWNRLRCRLGLTGENFSFTPYPLPILPTIFFCTLNRMFWRACIL